MSGRARVPFTEQQEDLLARYIAKYNPQEVGRQGNKLYQTLCENAGNRWPFSRHHTWQSWREHYISNRATIDRLVKKYIKQYHGDAFTASQPSASLPSTRSDSEARVQYTREDDDHLTQYIATHLSADTGILGQKFWMTLSEDADKYPWIKRHPWQSWRERYKKNQQYFDWAVSRYLDEDVPEDSPVPRPKTADGFLVRKPSANARAAERQSRALDSRRSDISASRASAASAEQRKRARTSGAVIQERPAKRVRTQGEAEADSNPPSTSKTALDQAPADVDQVSTTVEDAGPPEDPIDVEIVQDRDAANVDEEDARDSGDDEPAEPPGSDDYDGEIFSSPAVAADDVAGDVPDNMSEASEGTVDEEEELDQLLGDEGDEHEQILGEVGGSRGEADANQLVDEGADVSEAPADDPRIFPQAEAPRPPATHQTAACTEVHVLPIRKHNTRIRETEVPLLTPELSPTQEAVARHHEQQPFTAPRRHVKRIQKRQEDDIFRTPSSATRSPSLERGDVAEEPSSPAEAEARHHTHAHDQDAPKLRQPPRLDEGAFNKAFSDAHGRSRVSPSGKPRRQSGVDLEDVDEVTEEQDNPATDEGEDLNEEHVSELPQWPPVRKRKSSGKGKAPESPSTPSPTRTPRGKGHSRTVTTKEFVSVTTVRTVERRLAPRQPKGTPFPRGAIADASEPEDQEDVMDVVESSASPPRHDADLDPVAADGADMDVDENQANEATWPSPSQHHPFSQSAHPFSQVDEPSSRQSNIPVSSQDVSLFQRLLHPQPTEASSHSNRAPSTRVPGRTKSLPLSEADRMRLNNILQMEGKRAFPGPSKQDRRLVEPASMVFDVVGDSTNLAAGISGARQTTFQRSGTSPLDGKGDPRPTSAERLGKIVPPAPSSSRVDPAVQLSDRVSKGKNRADAIEGEAPTRRYTVGGYASSDVFYQPERPASRRRSKRLRQSHSPAFALGDEGLLANRTALSLAFHPPPFDVLRSRSAPIPSTSALSRSVSPSKSADASHLELLPPHELDMVQRLGMNTAIHIMARNHGWSEETVREVHLRTKSLEAADNLLRRMREVANEEANRSLASILSDNEDTDGDEDEDMKEDEEYEHDDENFDEREGHAGDEAEVERELTQPPTWVRDGPSFDLDDEAPLAESSRIDASHIRNNNSSFSSRKKQQLRIQPLRGDANASISTEYSPPKHTRAAQYVKRARESLGHRRNDAAAADASTDTLHTGTEDDITFGKLARLNQTEWQELEKTHGKGSAKVVAGKALAKFLQH
ncbi:hypothetical protein C8Q73DRAFT_126463 [Cubamyces lactineus]|nr:hypothetical protein C8Q73DRAFT_126463 [Cubamyces lactineus]